ncbi:hypothetical protein AB0A70_06715 [Streptomyces morookaense]|uniref:hypothetical protein n=1 Tax=Streptomyces morookaense TaxID=1970 RepID=UPI0034104CFA
MALLLLGVAATCSGEKKSPQSSWQDPDTHNAFIKCMKEAKTGLAEGKCPNIVFDQP